MAARRRYLDPETGDYVLENGGPREDMTPASRVVLRLRTRRGSIPGLPWFGCRLFEVKKITPSTPMLVKSYVTEALADLVAAGQLPGLQVTATAANGSLSVEVSYRDPSGVRKVVPYTQRVV